jgi:hypothetical protein
MRKIIFTTLKEYLNEQKVSTNPSDYTGSHSAPSKFENDQMCDVSNMLPDIYTDNAYKYYGGQDLDDNSVINQIKRVRNKPNSSIMIYRSVPYLNKDIDMNIKKLNDILTYFHRWKFLPKENKIVKSLLEKYKDLKWHEWDDAILKDINDQKDLLLQQKEKSIKINNGDWVTTSKMYAKLHGESNLNNNYKILTKTVKASQLYTNGDSIFEWGYNV